jgi:SAM-dependent methyltransferase
MHPRFLELLHCPETGAALTLTSSETRSDGRVVEGALLAPSGRSYPIVRGVPRFVAEERYAASFGRQWNRWPRVQFESENVGQPMAGHTTRMWETVTAAPASFHGARVVEFGCGSGRFLDVVRARGGLAVGLELSTAVEAAASNFTDCPDVLVVQGDLLHPPFRPGVFDAGYSIGVLHHTPEPARGLAELAKIVRPGGWVACSIYPRKSFYDSRALLNMRWMHGHLSAEAGNRFASAYAWFSARVLAPAMWLPARVPLLKAVVRQVRKRALPWLTLPSAAWRQLDMYDAITPSIATTHAPDELRAWFDAACCRDVRPTPWGATSAVAIRA